MASPYILLIISPSLSRFLPRSGPWITYVEKGIAFFLLGTAFYLVGIALGGASLRILAPLWVILFGGWLWVRSRVPAPGDSTRPARVHARAPGRHRVLDHPPACRKRPVGTL